MRTRRRTRIWCASAALAVAFAAAFPALAAERIVSTNLCTDQLALLMLPREKLLSVSTRAADPTVSNTADLAATVPLNDGRVEEVAALRPDLVITDDFWNAKASAFLERLGLRVVRVPTWAASVEEVRRSIRATAAVLDVSEKGEAMIAELDARLAAVRAAAEGRVPRRALIYEPNGFTSAAATLPNELAALAGFQNAAGGTGVIQVSLEAMVLLKPDILIINSDRPGGRSAAERMLDHPAMRALPRTPRRVWLPSRLWLCPGPWVADAAELLLDAGRLPADASGR